MQLTPLSTDAAGDTVAGSIIDTLSRYGVEYIFLNPGTDTAPFQEALDARRLSDRLAPRVITCPHEGVALAAAHAYWRLRKRPQCVMVHVDVGTQNLGAMLHNAMRDRAGVVIIAGKAPYSIDPDVPGSRSGPIHWRQDVPDQAGIVRGYSKSAVEIGRPDLVERAVGRALQVAASSPAGTTYLIAARDVLMEPAVEARESPRDYRPPLATGLSPSALAEIADVLEAAERPLLISSSAGRDPAAVPALLRLVETLGMAVAGTPENLFLPFDHPLWMHDPADFRELLHSADVVLVAECDVPWLPGDGTISDDATLVLLDEDPVHVEMPLWSYPADIVVAADPTVAFEQLASEISERRGRRQDGGAAWDRRAEAIQARKAPLTAPASIDELPTVHEVCTALNELMSDDDIFVEESVTNAFRVHAALRRRKPGTYLHPGGPGLGWALGAAIGAKLAAPEANVVAMVGDGAFLFAQPLAALQVAAEAQTPFMAVVLDNGGYYAAERPVRELFPDGASVALGDVTGTKWTAFPDLARLAEACHGAGFTVSAAGEAASVFAQAWKALKSGKAVVVHVHLPPGVVVHAQAQAVVVNGV